MKFLNVKAVGNPYATHPTPQNSSHKKFPWRRLTFEKVSMASAGSKTLQHSFCALGLSLPLYLSPADNKSVRSAFVLRLSAIYARPHCGASNAAPAVRRPSARNAGTQLSCGTLRVPADVRSGSRRLVLPFSWLLPLSILACAPRR